MSTRSTISSDAAALIERLDEFGITRLADTTGMDRIGVPTAAAVKPGTADGIWIYSGKGLTQHEARLVAIVECLERTSSLWDLARVRWAREDELVETGDEPWGPARFTERPNPRWTADSAVGWVRGTALRDGRDVWLPADLVFQGRRPADLPCISPFSVTTSNGLGAGLTIEHAVSHALAEVMERDVVSCVELLASHAGAGLITGIAQKLGLREDLDAIYVDNLDHAVTVDVTTLPSELQELVDRIARAGLEVVVKALPNDFGMPAFAVTAVEQVGLQSYLACAGYGLHMDKSRALRSAALELAQTRATDLQGAREDRHHVGKQRFADALGDHWLTTPGKVLQPWAAVFPDSDVVPEAAHEPATYLQALRLAGLQDAAVVEFGAVAGVHTARVLVPGAETWHCTAGWSRLGPRMRARLGRP
jgi:ribosomal protein S12 methylthiotransferase accessory factor